MGGIEDHRAAQGLQLGQAAVVHHQRVVSEAAAPLREPQPATARLQAAFGQLAHHLGHVPRRQELALFHIHHLGAAGHCLGGRLQQVGLPAQKRRDLQHVHRLGGSGGLVALVDVGEHLHPEALAHLRQDRQTLLGARPAERLAGAAVGLVEAGLEHVLHPQPPAQVAHLLGHLQHQVAVLDHARAGDQAQGGGHRIDSGKEGIRRRENRQDAKKQAKTVGPCG